MQLGMIAEALGCELRGDGRVEVRGLAPIEDAGPGELTFVANSKYRSYLRDLRASAVILAESEIDVPVPSLRGPNPYLLFARVLRLFYVPPAREGGIHPTAVVAKSARIAPGAEIGPYCVIGSDVVIGARARLDAHVVIYPEVLIGDDFRAHSNVTIRERITIGNRVTLQAGSVVGGDGFGYVPTAEGGIEKIVQAGTVVLEDDVEIGCNATVDRATIGRTVIGASVKLDNLVQIGHGCRIGEKTVIAAQAGLSGSTVVGRGVRIGGQVGTAGHQTIGDLAQIAAQSGVPGDVGAGETVGGYPAQAIQIWRRVSAALPRLPELLRRVRRLERAAGLSGQ